MEQKPTEISLKEIQSIILTILKDVTSFCEANDINYILSDGTLLGAVRHKGFIPWDDDIDISMLRSDYEKFIKLWKDTEKYKLVCHELDDTFYLPFAKIVDKTMIAFESGRVNTTKGGLWVDIFPLDAIPDTDEERIVHWNRVVKKFDKYDVAYSSKNLSKFFLENILRRLRWVIKRRNIGILFAPLKKSFEKYEIEIKKYNDKACMNVTNNVSIRRRPERRKFGYSKTLLTEYEYAQFETEKFRIPKDYDSILKSYYNDYMKLPSEKERKATHKIAVIKLSEE